jgi:YHS domain-containing protein
MNVGKKQLVMMSMLLVLLTVGLAVLNGCKKSEPQTTTGHEGHDHAAMTAEPAAPAETKEVASAAIEQTVCPVMVKAINKDIFTEYKGKKVYFCCAGCKEKFEKEPAKYLAKLPQFKN